MEDRMTAQQLKNSILQMAVQGKLVPQDPNDEPASVLLERIRKEKDQLIKEGKIKKNKNESYIFRGADNLHYEQVGKEVRCIEDELPFEIPKSWEWVHINNISDSYLGKTLNKSKDSGISVPYLCSINIHGNTIDLNTVKNAPFSDEEREKYKLIKNDLLICEGGDVGRTAIWNLNEEMYFQNALHRVRFFKDVQPYFFLCVLSFFKDSKLIEKVSKGVTIKHFVQGSLFSLYFPLPPLNEQQRIVGKIKELEPLIEKYKQTEEKLYELNSSIKDQLKKSILQYAIEGKLVPQNPNDEPASVLLEKIHDEKERLIKEGKIKRDKNESIIYRRDNSYYEKQDKNETCIDEEIAFEIPERYVLVRLKTICSLYTGNSINQADKTRLFTNQENGRNYIGTKDLDFNHCFDYNNGIKIPETYAQFKEAPKDSILLCIEGGSAGRKVGILNQTVCFGNKLCCFTPFLIEPRYIYYYLQSFQFISQFKDKMSGIIGGVSIKQIENILIPIPSINEQKLIIEKIEKVVKEA